MFSFISYLYVFMYFAEFGPLYTQLGVAKSIIEIAKVMANRMSISEEDVRVVPISYCPKESIDINGCPVANHIISRGQEKVLVLAKLIPDFNFQIVLIVKWESVPMEVANYSFEHLRSILGNVGSSFKHFKYLILSGKSI